MTGGMHDPSLHWIDRLATGLARTRSIRMNRRNVGSAGVLSVIGAALFGTRIDRATAQDDSAVIAVLADATALEGLMVTLLGVARTKASDLTLDDSIVRMIRSAQCEDEAHFDNLATRGGSPTVATYTIADTVFTDSNSFLAVWSSLVDIMSGLYMAGVRQAALSGQTDLVEIMYQIGAVESQHLALIRQAMGERIPADRAFPVWQFRTTADAVARIRTNGFIGGSGTSYDYPGPGDRYCRGVTGLVAETTSDQTDPDVTAAPPLASPDVATPSSSPVAYREVV
jgi:Ferritin-like domain